MTGPEMEKAIEGLPKVLWVNSHTAHTYSARCLSEPLIIDDAMPDGFHYEPTPKSITGLINQMKHDAIVRYYERVKAEKG